MANATVAKARTMLNRPLWAGGHTLTLGELIFIAIAAVCWYFHVLGKWSAYLALAILVLAFIIW